MPVGWAADAGTVGAAGAAADVAAGAALFPPTVNATCGEKNAHFLMNFLFSLSIATHLLDGNRLDYGDFRR